MTKLVTLLRPLLLCALLTSSLEGCGLRGDLYLPEDESGTAPTPASTEVLQSGPLDSQETQNMEGFTTEPEQEESDQDESDEDDEVSPLDTVLPPSL